VIQQRVRWMPRLTLTVLAVACGCMLLASPALGQQGDDLIVDDVGFDFVEQEPTVCARPSADGGEREFRGPHGLLCIARSGRIDRALIASMVAAARDPEGADFPIRDVEPAVGQVLEPNSSNPSVTADFGAGSYYYTILLVRSAPLDPAFDAAAFVADLARRHVSLVDATQGGSQADAAVPGPAPTVDGDLSTLLADVDRFTKISDPIADVHLGAGIAETNDVARALTAGTSSALQFYAHDGGTMLGVLVSRYRFPLFAAAVVGDRSAPGIESGAREPFAALRRDVMSVADEVAGITGAAFRQGRYHYLVVIAADADVPPGQRLDVIGQLAGGLYDQGPGGSTAPFVFASVAEATWQTVVLVLGLGLVVMVIRRIVARRPPRVDAEVGSAPTLTDVEPQARAIRLRSRAMIAAQLVSVALIIVGLAVLSGPASVMLALFGATTGTAVGLVARRIDRPAGGSRRPVPALRGVLVGVPALAVLLAGVAILVRGAGTWLFTPALSHLELSDRLAVDPVRLSQLMVAVGLVLTVAGGGLVRVARRFASATAERMRRTDQRPDVLYLRAFEDDTLPIPTAATSRRPFVETFTLLGREPFDECLAWQLSQHGPVVAVGQPHVSRSSLGPALEYLPDNTWQPLVAERMRQAQRIVMVVGRSAGVAWELDHLVRNGHLAKTLFVTPPVATLEIRARWDAFCVVVGQAGVPVARLIDPSAALVLALDAYGRQVGVTARRRDEAAYRAAIDRAFAMSPAPAG